MTWLTARRRAAVLGIALAPLAACAGQPTPNVFPTPAARPLDSTAEEAAVRPPAVEPLPGGAPTDATRLIGTKGDSLREWMGNTSFVRKDGPAEIWRFAADTCFLDVFLYQERDGLRVAHLDARARIGTQRVTPQACYSRILTMRQARQAS